MVTKPAFICLKDMSFQALYDLYFRRIYAFVYSLVGNGEEAEDLTQETFMKLYLHLENNGNLEKPKPWIYRVAANISINHLKRRQAFIRILGMQTHRESDYRNVEADLIKDDEIERVRRALNELPTRDRVMLMLYQDNCSYGEIAQVMKIKKTSVGKILCRARLKLAEKIREGAKNEMLKKRRDHPVSGR